MSTSRVVCGGDVIVVKDTKGPTDTDTEHTSSNNHMLLLSSSVAKDEIHEWQLSFRFADFRMEGPVWRGFQNAGWKHSNSNNSYSTPIKDQVFLSSMDVFTYLDQFGISPLQNTLQLAPENPLNGLSSEEIRRGKDLRNQVVKHIYLCMPHDTNKDDDDDETLDDTSRVETQETTRRRVASSRATTSTTKQLPSRRSTRQRAPPLANYNSKETMTTFEKGADVFLRKPKGSKRTPSTHEIVDLPFPSLTECLHHFRDYPTDALDQIEETYTRHFDNWRFLLSTQHSLLLHGFGSKRHLLESFAREMLDVEGDVLQLDGYDNEIRIEAILNLLVEHFLDGQEPARNDIQLNSPCRIGVTPPSRIASHKVVQRATRIAQALAVQQRERTCPLFLVIHSVDGPALRNRDIQEALAALVAHSTMKEDNVNAVRLVASVDHVNSSALLWDNRTSANFSWIWKEVHTYRPYMDEMSVGMVEDNDTRQQTRSRKSREDDEMEDATLLNVLTSLAPRHAEVVKVLATLQSENNNSSHGHVDHSKLLEVCKGNMTVSNDSALRGYIRELLDHGIVQTGKDSKTGREWLRIPHSHERLQEIKDFEIQKA